MPAAVIPQHGDHNHGGRVALTDHDARTVADALIGGICVVDAHGEIRWSNAWVEQASGELRETLGQTGRAGLKAHAGGEYQRRVEIDGRTFDMRASPAPVHESSSVAGMAVCLVRDVTSRIREQRKLEAINQAGQELVRLDADVVREMHAAERLAFFENKILRSAKDLLQYDNFIVWLIDESTNRLELVMCKGFPEAVKALDLYALPEGNGTAGYVAATGNPYISIDTGADPLYAPGLDSPEGSAMTTPVRLHDKVVGVFNVESTTKNAFTDDDLKFVAIFANYVGMALHMLDMLVVERVATGQTFGGVVEGEINGPLDHLAAEAEWLRHNHGSGEAATHIGKIFDDITAIRDRIRSVAKGPRALLGIDSVAAIQGREQLFAGRRVLVADDEKLIRTTIRDILVRRGAEVVVCQNGAEAVEQLAENAFDFVISDISMPDRNGYEVFAATKQACPGTPVVLMTGFGYDRHHSVVRASQEGLQSVLFKPFHAQRVVDEACKAFGMEPQGDG